MRIATPTRPGHLRVFRILRPLAAACLAGLLASCVWLQPEPGIGTDISWQKVPGWADDRHAEAWPALLQSCARQRSRDAAWGRLCDAAATLPNPPGDTQARHFFETWFVAHRVHGAHGKHDGLITGYYEPLLYGSLLRSERYRYPLYRRPPDLLTIELGDLFPELKQRRVRGRIQGSKVVPYFSRAELDADPNLIAGNELLWVDDPTAVFFLHIQGSGRVQLDDGRVIAVGYADQNGHPYRSVGKRLVEMGELALEDVSLFTIRAWLRDNPDKSAQLLNSNPSYVFFARRDETAQGPRGSLNVPLTPERSLAVDPATIPLGIPVWLDTTRPGDNATYRRLMFAQDTGGAIKGHVRADVFWGRGDHAERMAGEMKQAGRLYALLPRPVTDTAGR